MNFPNRCSFSERKKLPKIKALYAVYACEDLLYIGCSTQLNSRFTNHHKLEQFFNEGADCIYWLEYKDNVKLYDDELKLINEHKPKLNLKYARQANASSVKRLKGIKPELKHEGFLTVFVFDALWEFISNNPSKIEALRKIEKDTSLNVPWLKTFADGITMQPGVNKIDELCVYLTGQDLLHWLTER